MKRIAWAAALLACLFCLPGKAGAVELSVAGKSALLMDVSTGALRGMGSSLEPMIISVLGICGLRLVWIYTIFQVPEFHTPECLYFSYLVSWIITFLIQMAAFIQVYRKAEKAA